MSATFASQLRVKDAEAVRLAPAGVPVRRVRVQSADAWYAVRVDATPDTSVAEVKRAAIAALHGDREHPADFVTKLRGWEILDERDSLEEAEVVDGATLLVHVRRKRPVR